MAVFVITSLSYLLDQKRIALLAGLDLVGHPSRCLATARPSRAALRVLVLWLHNTALVFAFALGWRLGGGFRFSCGRLAIAYGLAGTGIRRNTSRS